MRLGLQSTEGRIDKDVPQIANSAIPVIVTDATRLRKHHVDTGNMNHPDGPPEQPPPILNGDD